MTLDQILLEYKKTHSEDDIEQIRSAYEFAKNKHHNQKRLSGERYIIHPFEVAKILIDLDMDTESIMAAFLHDTIEDTDTNLEEIEALFGQKVAELVDGVTKLGEIDFSKLPENVVNEAKARHETENLRKLFLAMAKDVRVVLIKLADRLHNMRTLSYLSKKNQVRISRETLEIFAPLADRLGMGAIKAELEDLAFKYYLPEEYKNVSEILEVSKKEREQYLLKIKRFVLKELEKEGIEAKIDGRIKHLYSIYNKLQKVDGDISKIYDLLAIRIIVCSVEDCYKVLGTIHKNFKPLIYRIKDYIAVPKPNGYQSLHTTVFGLDGKITEFQVRTHEMHEEAEKGVAAHWFYAQSKKEVAYQGKSSVAPSKHLTWVNKLSDWQETISTPEEFKEGLKIDLFSDRIFVFTPKGDVFDMPEGATPVDFAYEIHTQIGHRCRGARINGRIVPLDHKLENRDVVEIILAAKNDKTGPSRGWLEFITTSKARQNIRSFFKRLNWDENVEAGRKLLVQELSLFGMTEGDISEEQIRDLVTETAWKSWEDVLIGIGEGSVTPRQVLKRLIGQKILLKIGEEKETLSPSSIGDTSYSNLSGILVRYASCCHPVAGDEIKGFITQGQGISIHKADCKNLLASPEEKIINIDFEIPTTSRISIMVEGENRIGFIRDVTYVISDEKVNIVEIRNEHEDEKSIIYLAVSLESPDKLADLLHRLSKVDGVIAVKKQ